MKYSWSAEQERRTHVLVHFSVTRIEMAQKGAERDAEMRLVFLKNRRKAQKGPFWLILSQGRPAQLRLT